MRYKKNSSVLSFQFSLGWKYEGEWYIPSYCSSGECMLYIQILQNTKKKKKSYWRKEELKTTLSDEFSIAQGYRMVLSNSSLLSAKRSLWLYWLPRLRRKTVCSCLSWLVPGRNGTLFLLSPFSIHLWSLGSGCTFPRAESHSEHSEISLHLQQCIKVPALCCHW